jgi:hypothetical protein
MTAGRRTSAGLKTFMAACAWSILALIVACAQGVSGGNSLPDVPREVVLRPEAVPYVLESIDQTLAKSTKPFSKEPETSPHHVFRGMLQFGQDTNNAVALIWDQPKLKLYLDLSRNRDLTDDPGGVFSSTNKGYQQTFTNVTVPVKTAAGFQPVILDLQCFTDAKANWASTRLVLRSLWQAKVTFAGQEWQVAALDNLSGRDGPAAAKFLLLRPWAARTNRVWPYDSTSGIVPFPERLFWLGQACLLEHSFDTSGPRPLCKLEFTPQQPPLTELKLSSESLAYAVLRDTNGYTVVLHEPPATMKVPQGIYTVSAAWLKKGSAVAFRGGYQSLVVDATTATNLVLGGPLTNSVVLSRSGRRLIMDYKLQGVDGGTYQLAEQDRRKPPGFTVFCGGKKALSGKFEFG